MPGIRGNTWEHEGRLCKPSGETVPFHHPDGTVTWHQIEDATLDQIIAIYRAYITGGGWPFGGGPTPDRTADIQADLAGRDLACWCPLDQPCHADVLLDIANPGAPDAAAV